MSTIFTMPGKKGDALLQFPVARQWARQSGKKFTLWLDERELKPLASLFLAQDCVEAVEFKPGIVNYTCGGQPFHFGLETKDFLGHEIYHLGFRRFPERQITLQTALDVGLAINTQEMAEKPALVVEPKEPANRVVLHGTFTTHSSGSPRFWRFLRDIRHELEEHFDQIVFTGTPDERARAREIYPDETCGPGCAWADYDDQGDFLDLARFIAGSKLVIGSGSCVAALAGVLGVPTVRVHDPIGEYPRVIWSNLGSNQLNESEITLRTEWPPFLQKLLAQPVSLSSGNI